MTIPFAETRYGFIFGNAKVTRMMSDNKKGWVVLGLETEKHRKSVMQIYVTKTGKVRIYSKDGEWICEKKRKKK